MKWNKYPECKPDYGEYLVICYHTPSKGMLHEIAYFGGREEFTIWGLGDDAKVIHYWDTKLSDFPKPE